MSDMPTPLTDAYIEELLASADSYEPSEDEILIPADFARKLERALGLAKTALEKVVTDFNGQSGRLREATGDSPRFQFVEDAIQEAEQALAAITNLA